MVVLDCESAVGDEESLNSYRSSSCIFFAAASTSISVPRGWVFAGSDSRRGRVLAAIREEITVDEAEGLLMRVWSEPGKFSARVDVSSLVLFWFRGLVASMRVADGRDFQASRSSSPSVLMVTVRADFFSVDVLIARRGS